MKALLHARLDGLQHALEPLWVIGQVVFANSSTSEEECKVFQEALSSVKAVLALYSAHGLCMQAEAEAEAQEQMDITAFVQTLHSVVTAPFPDIGTKGV